MDYNQLLKKYNLLLKENQKLIKENKDLRVQLKLPLKQVHQLQENLDLLSLHMQ